MNLQKAGMLWLRGELPKDWEVIRVNLVHSVYVPVLRAGGWWREEVKLQWVFLEPNRRYLLGKTGKTLIVGPSKSVEPEDINSKEINQLRRRK